MFKVLALFLLATMTPLPVPAAGPGFFNTYAAWIDQGSQSNGYMHIYTTNFASTDFYLYAQNAALTTADTPNSAINALVTSGVGVGPLQPAATVGPFLQKFFNLNSTFPMIWEVEEDITNNCADSHDFLAAANSGNDYSGSIFMTYMRDDGGGDTRYGDDVAFYNPGGAAITVQVRRWNGAAWGAVLATSAAIPALGIWMWSPDQNAGKTSGGTDAAAMGDYRFDVAGGEAMAYKGNLFTPYVGAPKPGGVCNRNDVIHFAPDRLTGHKVGTDLIGAIDWGGYGRHAVVSNNDAAVNTIQIYKFVPTTAGVDWPVDGDDPSGAWVAVGAPQVVPALGSYFFDNAAGGNQVAGFIRIVCTTCTGTGNDTIEAVVGSGTIAAQYGDGDYLYALDTQRAYGRSYRFGTFLDGSATPVELAVIAPTAGTVVTVNLYDTGGALVSTWSQTNTSGGAAGLRFPLTSPTNSDFTVTITSSQDIYAYVMSTQTGSNPGETFFTVPPPNMFILLVNKSVDKATATIGDTLTYTLIAQNPGDNPLTSPQLWDTLPPGTTYLGSTPIASAGNSGAFYHWDLPSPLNPLQSYTLRFAVQVTAGANGSTKCNSALGTATSTPAFQSNTVCTTVIIPGADFQKSVNVSSANVGDTVTYTLNYFNTKPAPVATPKLNLEVQLDQADSQRRNWRFQITNHGTTNIDIRDLTICFWIWDNSPASQYVSNVNYGGDKNTGALPNWGGPAILTSITAFTAASRPDGRNASIQTCFTPSTANLIDPGMAWFGAQLGMRDTTWASSLESTADDYSYTASGAYTNNAGFVLYYQGQQVSEWTNSATPDLNTGVDPRDWVNAWDSLPTGITFVGGTPTAAVAGAVLSWVDLSVSGQQSAAFTWWGTVGAGLACSTVNNTADYISNTITGLSNNVSFTVACAGTPTFTPSATPTRSFTPSSTSTATPTFTPSATPTRTFTPSSTLTATPSSTPSPTPTRTDTPSSTQTPSRTSTPSSTNSPSPSYTFTQTATSSSTATQTPTPTPSDSSTVTPTRTATVTQTATITETDTPGPPPTRTHTASVTPTSTQTPSSTLTATSTSTSTSSATPSDTPSATQTVTSTTTSTMTPTSTQTLTPTSTPTASSTPTVSFTSTQSVTWTGSPTSTSTPTVSFTSTQTVTWTGSPTSTATASTTPTFTPTSTFSGSPTFSATPSVSFTYTATATSSSTSSATLSSTQTVTSTTTPSPSVTPTRTGTPLPSPTFTVSPTHSVSPTITDTPVPVPHRVTIGAYNSAGELVKILFDGSAQFLPGDLLLSGDSLGAGSGEGIDITFPGFLSKDGVQIGNSLKWLGDNNNGQSVDGGVYYLKAEIRDQFDNVTTLTKAVAVVNVATDNSLAIFNSAGELVYSVNLALAATGLGAPAGTRFVSLRLGEDNYAPEFDEASGSSVGLLPIYVRDEHGNEYTYFWDGRNNRGNPVASGNYQVQLIYRASGGAKTIESRDISVLRSDNPSSQVSAVLGPNPALRGAEVKVVYKPSAGVACIARVYNLAGELVGQGEDLRSSGSFTLKTERFASGTYLVVLEKIRGAQSVQSRQLIKLAVIR